YRVFKDSPPVDLSETNRFMDSLDKVIFLDKLDHIKKFCLKTVSMYFDQDLEELFISIKCSGPRVVPLKLFNCESLTALDLQFDNQQVLDQSPFSVISFQRLKRLRLSFIHFKDKALAMQLFSNCPVLEDLDMSNVSWKGLDVICFALPRLKEDLVNVKVKFDTPNLLSLMWCEYFPKEFIVVDSFPYLVEAGIRYSFDDGYTETRYDSLYNFVEKVSHVKHLMVSHTYFRPKILEDSSVIPRCNHSFRNLVSFEVDVIYYSQIGLLYDIILQVSPNLTSLIFHQLFSSTEIVQTLLLDIVPRCLLSCLKSIVFRKFHWYPQEMEVVRLFLESALVLHTITLGSSSKKPTVEEVEEANGKILEQLLAFSWASSDCVVKFSSP
ncbi:hypothetical protein MKX03_015861, partial [Papaver bracteatum]